MKTFPKTRPTKNISVFLALAGGNKTLETKGHRVTPVVLHKRLKSSEHETFERTGWYLTHEFTGLGFGVEGHYDYCVYMANWLLKQPIAWMLDARLMSQHPDYSDFFGRYQAHKSAYKGKR